MWQASETGSPLVDGDDGGTVIKPAAKSSQEGGRWVRQFSGPLDVKWFGAKGDDSVNDREAIQNALKATRRFPLNAEVLVSPGTYKLQAAIELEYSNVTLRGTSGSLLSLDSASSAVEVKANLPQPLEAIVIRDLSVQDINGKCPDSKGIVNLRSCRRFLLDNVVVVGGAVPPNPAKPNADGIALSDDCEWGRLTNCVVRNATKVGFYVTNGATNVALTNCQAIGCAANDSVGPIPGFSIVGKAISLTNCQARDNEGPGVFIGSSGQAARDVVISGGVFSNNGTDRRIEQAAAKAGIYIAGTAPSTQPTNVVVSGVICADNSEYGIHVYGGTNVTIVGAICRGAATGISVHGYNTTGVPTRVCIRDSACIDNGREGIWLGGNNHEAGTGITVASVQISGSPVGLRSQSFGAAPTNLRLVDIDNSAAVPYVWSEQTATSGYFRLGAGQQPEGVVPAPLGSEFLDHSTGRSYRKSHGGASNTGWSGEHGCVSITLPGPEAPYFLAAAEYVNRAINISGTIAAGRSIVFPLYAGVSWVVRNNTAGGFHLTATGVSGGGVVIPNGTTKVVFTDGVNFYG